MGLPARDEAREWVGWTVVDREGAELGACTAVLADESTGVPEWVYVEVEGASAVVPALDADGSGGRVTVAVTRAQVTAAPSVGGARELSTTQEADLYRHYGIDVSRQASETLLPAAAEDTPAAVDSGTTANAAAAADTPAPAASPAPAGTAPAAKTETPAASRRGPAVAVVALAAAAGVGVVRARVRRPVVRQSWPQRLWARRPWAPVPPSRAELVAGQVLAASVRVREGARHLGVTVAPLAAAAAESARHRAVRAGEGARHLGVMAAPLAVATAESARYRAVPAREGARHHGVTIAPLAAATTESARHRAALGAEELRHATRLASGATVAAVARARARV